MAALQNTQDISRCNVRPHAVSHVTAFPIPILKISVCLSASGVGVRLAFTHEENHWQILDSLFAAELELCKRDRGLFCRHGLFR
ncbi:MAG: hypothetical protein KA781_05630 [Aquabacterium sp.]|jgi:hypothetical protein|nr:hypothetical protein [Aquabacterium sp.]